MSGSYINRSLYNKHHFSPLPPIPSSAPSPSPVAKTAHAQIPSLKQSHHPLPVASPQVADPKTERVRQHIMPSPRQKMLAQTQSTVTLAAAHTMPTREVETERSIYPSRPDTPILEDSYATPSGSVKETVTRYDVVSTDRAICKKMIAELTGKPGREVELQYYQSQLHILDQPGTPYSKGWVDSNATRSVLKEASTFKKGTEGYLSAPVNARYHEMEGLGGVVRLGVISDMTQGWVSLHDLKKPDKLATCARHIQQQMYSPKTGDTTAKMKRKLGMKAPPMERGTKMHQSATQAQTFIEQCADPKFREKAIQQRRACLEKQMLHLILMQADKHPEKLKGGSFDLVHLCLLNPRSNTIDKTGWMHSEQKELEDMREIFAEFQGRNLICDGKGPYIDDRGDIHLPTNTGKTIPLNTYIFNVCPQVNDHNEGIQLETNKAQWEKMKKSHNLPPELGIRLLNPKTKSNFDLASSLLDALLNTDAAVSAGCLSAKDRTSFVIGSTLQRRLGRKYYPNKPNPHRDRPLHPDSVGSRVIDENTRGVRTPKVSPLEVREGTSTQAKVKHAFNFAMQHVFQRRYIPTQA